ncbi:SNF2-related protein [Tessaracoccus sp.]
MTPPLRPSQLQAIQHLQTNPVAGLFMDMGMGKTAAVLRALRPEDLPVLVVAPKRVAEEVWPEEAAEWRPDLTLTVASGNPAQRQARRAVRTDITVVGREHLAEFLRPGASAFQTFVLDELSGFKTWGTGRFRAARALKKRYGFRNVWGLTGTPAPNGLLDLWAQLYTLDSGARLGTTLGGFRHRYFTPKGQLANGIVTSWELRPGADGRIYNLIGDICLSLKDANPAPTTLNRVKVPLPEAALKVYRQMEADMVADLRILGGEIHTAAGAAVVTLKLSQVTAGFLYSDLRDGTWTKIHSEKMKALAEIVEGTGGPLLVFYSFIPELEMIKKAFPGRVYTSKELDLQARWNAGEFPILAAHPASIGHGLNLQKGPGHTIVWTSPTWDFELWDQGNKRLARPGQKETVMIHVLETPNSVDGKILRAVEGVGGKRDVQDALRDYLEVV